MSAAILSIVFMLNVFMLNVVAPKNILNKSNLGKVFKILHVLHKLQIGPIS